MKRLLLTIGIAGTAAIAATAVPASAQSSCAWYDVSCRLGSTTNNGTVDGTWHSIGQDANGNTIYERRRVDGNRNVVVERARRNSLGQLVLINSQVANGNVSRNVRYGVNGSRCKYQENDKGYKEECKYDRNGNLFNVSSAPSGRFGTAGTTDCKYQSSNNGYKEECKYAKVNNKYKPVNVKSVKYEPAKLVKAKGPKAQNVWYDASQDGKHGKGDNAGKGKGPKH
jgi:hypothetical protein